MRSEYFTEHMRDTAIERTRLPHNAVVADIGTGTGFVAAGSPAPRAMVYGFDASPQMLEVHAKNLAAFPNIRLRQAAGDAIPLPDELIDGVFANMYLHHVSDPFKAISEMVTLAQAGWRALHYGSGLA